VALFSDLDWLIVLGAAALLLFGHGSASTVRQLGRWYGRALRLKQELVGELARAADLPMPADGGGSLRAALLGLDVDAAARARLSVPLAARTPPPAPPPPGPASPFPWTGGSPVTTWAATCFPSGPEPRTGEGR
jgi:hypothetical protein